WLARMLSGEFAFLTDDQPEVAEHWETFWSHAPPGVAATSGYDRLLAPTASSAGIEDLLPRRAGAVGYYHETARTPPGGAPAYVEQSEQRWRPVAERCGMEFMGGFRTMLCNDSETVTLW